MSSSATGFDGCLGSGLHRGFDRAPSARLTNIPLIWVGESRRASWLPPLLAVDACAVSKGCTTARRVSSTLAKSISGDRSTPTTVPGADNAVDRAASNIYLDKWCVPAGRPSLTVYL